MMDERALGALPPDDEWVQQVRQLVADGALRPTAASPSAVPTPPVREPDTATPPVTEPPAQIGRAHV